MNRIHIILERSYVIFLAFCMVSCDFKEFNEGEWLSTTEKQEELYIHVSPNSMDFGPNDGNTKPLSITSNTNWNISVTHDWCHVSVLSGTGSQELTVFCDKNSTNKNRHDTIRVISSVEPIKIPVFQSSAPYYISIVDNRPVFDSNGESKTIFVQSNVDWRFKRHPENSSGIATIRKIENELSLTVGNNPYAIERTDTIVVEGVEYTSLSDTIYITQKAKPPYLTINNLESPESMYIDDSGGTHSFSVESNAEWKINVTCDDQGSWCKLSSPSNGLGKESGNVSLSIEANSILSGQRSATIAITTISGSPSITRTFKLYQAKGPDGILKLADGVSELNLKGGGESLTFTIESNIGWKISNVPEWCTVSPTESSQTKTITVVAERNGTADKRSATLSISPNPSNSQVNTVTITLTQDALDIPGGGDNPNPHYSRKR